MFSIAVDVMGGDLGPRVALKACKKLLKQRPDARLIICIVESELNFAIRYLRSFDRVTCVGCESQIAMSDKPARVLRDGLNSTMAQALREVKEGRAQAVLSAGNTGALMALSMAILGTLNGIDRPALATLLPTRHKPLLMLDLGANLNVPTDLLMQFAALGYCWSARFITPDPKLALLNVGKEVTKGTERIKDCDQRLQAMLGDSYVGFAEGNDIYQGELDVLITDGFVGNVVLKASESLCYWLIEQMHTGFKRHWLRRFLMPLWWRAVNHIEARMSPARNSGALMLGVDGIVVKTHGSSDNRTFLHALNYVSQQAEAFDKPALEQALHELQEKIKIPFDE